MEIISLKCDYCFKEWLANETIRRYFISDVLDIPVEEIRSVQLGNTFLWKRYRMQKQGILDVLVELNDKTKINIEMQTTFVNCWDRRNLFYLAKMYTEDLRVGEQYGRLKRCIGISILDFDFTGGEDYHTVYRLRDERGNEFSDVFEIHIIELGKRLKGTERVDDWIRIINAEKMEDLSMIQARNIGIKTAIEEIKRMSLSRRLRMHYDAYWKAKRDAWAIKEYKEEQDRIFEQRMEENSRKLRAMEQKLEQRSQELEMQEQKVEQCSQKLEIQEQKVEQRSQELKMQEQKLEQCSQKLEQRKQELEAIEKKLKDIEKMK